MSTNKHATIRYHALDQCFGNTGRRYFMEDLIDAIDSALFEFKKKIVFNEEDWRKMFGFMVQRDPKFGTAFKKPIQLLSRK